MSNNKLKHAVSLALAIFALSAQQQALALGLGEIEVKSHLGQPLKAKIKVYGAADLKAEALESGCFKLNADTGEPNQISNAKFALNNIVGDEATLTVTTAQIVNEPIANLSIVAECGSAMRRDYVLLLDPMMTAETTNESDEIVTATAAPKEANKAKKSTKGHTQLEEASARTSVKKTKNVKKQAKNKATENKDNPNIILHMPGSSEQTPVPTAEKMSKNNNQPHLSISGGVPASTHLIGSSLMLDKQLTFTPDPNAQPIAEDVELQDDLTAMKNRFANLEKQIAKLQQQNLVLNSDNQFKTQQIAETNSIKDKFKWMGYALGVVLVLVSGQIATQWWRRREPKRVGTGATWVSTGHVEEDEASLNFKSNMQSFDNSVDNSANEAANFEPNHFGNTIEVEESTIDNTVLDHADVFLSHGRTSMAIQLLQNHLLDHPKQSVTIWLFLLDLLTKENMQAVYEQTALECKEHFNIKISTFAEDEDENKSKDKKYASLESFTRLSQGLQEVWGTPAGLVYLDDLIYNNRLETRAGFDKNLIEELLLLKSIAQDNLNTAEVIQLDDKKLALKEQKEAVIAAKAAEKKQELEDALMKEQAKTSAADKLYEFGLVEWN